MRFKVSLRRFFCLFLVGYFWSGLVYRPYVLIATFFAKEQGAHIQLLCRNWSIFSQISSSISQKRKDLVPIVASVIDIYSICNTGDHVECILQRWQ